MRGWAHHCQWHVGEKRDRTAANIRDDDSAVVAKELRLIAARRIGA